MRRPPLQLPAVTFSAGRFTPAQADASRAQNPVTANPEESILKGVGDVMSYPQRRMVEAITGTYQDPSAALGIQNPVAAFATDVVLDPTNAIPAGALAKLFGRGAKAAGAADEAVSLARRPISVSNVDAYRNKNYIDSSKLVGKSIGGEGQFYRVPDELRNQMELEVMRGGNWLADWYSYRTDKIVDLLTPRIKNEYRQARDFGIDEVAEELKDSEKYIRKAISDEFMANSFRSELEPSNIMDLNAKVLGVSSNHFDGITQYAKIPKPDDPKNVYNYVLMAADQNPTYTAIHEGTHGMDFALKLTRTQDEYHNFDFGSEVFENIQRHSPDMPIKDVSYYSDPKEIYARTNELRYMANLNPRIEVTEEMAKKLLKFDNLAKGNEGVFNTFLGTNPRSLARWMNTMPALAGAAMIGNQTQQR